MTKVIAVGSPFGADRLGWLAVDHLAQLGAADCEWIKLDRPGSRLLDYFDHAATTIIIDALVWAEQPGGVRSLALHDLQRLQQCSSSHGFGLAETLALGAALNRLPQTIHLFGIHTGDDLTQTPQIDLKSLERLVLPLI